MFRLCDDDDKLMTMVMIFMTLLTLMMSIMMTMILMILMMLTMSSRVQLLDFDHLAEGALAQSGQDLIWNDWSQNNF